MADKKIWELTELLDAAAADILAIGDDIASVPLLKFITLLNLFATLKVPIVTTQEITAAAAIISANGINGKVSRVLSAQFSTSDTLSAAVITTTETNFATNFVIPANLLVANKVLRVHIAFQYTSSAGAPTSTIRLKFGTVVLYAGLSTLPVGSTNLNSGATFIIQGTGAAGAVVSVETGIVGAIPASVPPGPGSVAQGVNVATNAAQTLRVSWQFGAGTAGNTVTLRQLIIEELN